MKNISEGALYKSMVIENEQFDIVYGYYSPTEREHWGPTPLFPDFEKSPKYTKDGYPFATAEQTICEYYKPKETESGENWCNDCKYFELAEEIIGVCKCKKRRCEVKIRQNE